MHIASPAVYYDGKTAAAHAVQLQYAGDMLRITTPQGEVVGLWEQGHIRSEFPQNMPLRLRHMAKDGERVLIKDPALAENMRAWLAPALRELRAARRIRWFFAAFAAWICAAGLWVASPHLLTAVTRCIPVTWEEKLGEKTREAVADLLAEGPANTRWRTQGPGAQALQNLTTRLAGDDTAGYTLRVAMLDSTTVNAFTLPGGYIIVTTALVRQCSGPDELAGVLAHEMGHVTERHTTRGLVRDEFLSFAGRILTGGSDVLSAMNSAGGKLLAKRFSRDDERNADMLGLQRLAKAKINPAAMGLFFSRLPGEKNPGSFIYLSSHPSNAERMAYLAAEAAKLPGKYTPALTSAEWERLKELAK